jgi:hypothetical protein
MRHCHPASLLPLSLTVEYNKISVLTTPLLSFLPALGIREKGWGKPMIPKEALGQNLGLGWVDRTPVWLAEEFGDRHIYFPRNCPTY